MMRRALNQAILAGLLLLGGLTGCSKPVVREKPVPDPLLTSKKPVEGRSGLSESARGGSEDLLLPPAPPPPGMDLPRPPGDEPEIVRLLGIEPAQR
jgi:hypothetical protein